MGSYGSGYAALIHRLDARRAARMTTQDALSIIESYLDDGQGIPGRFIGLDDLDMALRFLYRPSTLPMTPEWQPIETAPKDDSEFLAYDSRTGKMDVCRMENISTAEPLWVCRPTQWDGENGPYSNEFGYKSEDITKWMPLPAPPVTLPADRQDG